MSSNLEEIKKELQDVSHELKYSSEYDHPFTAHAYRINSSLSIEVILKDIGIIKEASSSYLDQMLENFLASRTNRVRHVSPPSTEGGKVLVEDEDISARVKDFKKILSDNFISVEYLSLSEVDGEEEEIETSTKSIIIVGQCKDDSWIGMMPKMQIDQANFSLEDCYKVDCPSATRESQQLVEALENCLSDLVFWRDFVRPGDEPELESSHWLIEASPDRHLLIDKLLGLGRLIHQCSFNSLENPELDEDFLEECESEGNTYPYIYDNLNQVLQSRLSEIYKYYFGWGGVLALLIMGKTNTGDRAGVSTYVMWT